MSSFLALGQNRSTRPVRWGYPERRCSGAHQTLAKEDQRTPRNSYAFRSSPFGALFYNLTIQGYSDDYDEDTAAVTGLSSADGNATTLGFKFRQGRFTLDGEGGTSDWEEKGYVDEGDEAWILDAAWQGTAGTPPRPMPINWMANSWLSLTGDIRHTENERAKPPPGLEPPVAVPYSPNAVEADSWMLSANLAIVAVEGLNLQLSHSESDGKNDGGGENDQQDSAINLQFNRDNWSSGIGYQHGDYENDAASASNSSTDGWNVFIGRDWVESSGSWNIGTTVTYSDQRQSLDTGARNSNQSYQLALNGQHVRFGQSLSGTTGVTRPAPHQRGIRPPLYYPTQL